MKQSAKAKASVNQAAKAKASVNQAAKAPSTFVPKVLKNVTLPFLKLEEDQPIYVKIISKMRTQTAKMTDSPKVSKKGEKDMEPATVVDVVNMKTGEEANMIVNAVLKGNWEEQYPNDSYVDKGFSITKLAKRPGKRYNDFLIQEIAV
jgi:hypothetical protein